MAYQGKRGNRSRTKSGKSSRSGNYRGGGGQHRGGGRRGPKKEMIHPSKFIKKAIPIVEEDITTEHRFADFDMAPILAKNIAKKGFERPSPIQDQAIPMGLRGADIIGIANTGTGKTIAFGIPVINRLLVDAQARVLIMAPTRELAHQIEEEFKMLIAGTSLTTALLIGGASMHRQVNKLKRKPRIIIGTPGRIKDHLQQKKLKLAHFNTIVLDEVDRMLDMGFIHDMREILGRVSHERQSFFFSATMDENVEKLIAEFSQKPVVVSVKTGNTSDHVEQNIIKYSDDKDKLEKLHDILTTNHDGKFIIFKEMKYKADRLGKELVRRGFKADSIHGGKSQGQRSRALENFKRGRTQILVATDVAARGIDVKDISHVINYETPQSYDDYVHRIGRAGRAGKMGQALTFIKGQDTPNSARHTTNNHHNKKPFPKKRTRRSQK